MSDEIPLESLSVFIAATAERFIADLDELIEETSAAALTAAPALGQDVALEQSVKASIRAMTVRWAGAQRSRPGQTVPVDVPLEAIDVAREMTRHGIDFKKFLAAYRCSENVSSRRWLRATGEVVPPPKVALVAEYGLSSMNTWVDTILTSISAQIEREHDELTGSALARRLETAKLIIDGSPIRENVAQDRLGYELSAWHVGIVLWSSSAEQGTGIREKTAHLLALATGRRPPLILSVTAATAWVWLGDERPIDIRLLRDAMTQASEGVLGAAGSPAPHLAGFRRTHREAVAARRLAERNPGRERFVVYDDARLAVLASQDEEGANQFVIDTLGGLIGADADLSETLRVYLREDANATRAAAQLFTHRNTVLNRLDRAEQLLPQPLSGNHLRVGLALEILHWSGGMLSIPVDE